MEPFSDFFSGFNVDTRYTRYMLDMLIELCSRKVLL